MTQKGSGENTADTSLQGEFKVVIVGDSACGKSSLLHVYTSGAFPQWYPEVQNFCQGVPFILVGCKADLRKEEVLMKKLLSSGQNAVTNIQREEAREKLSAVSYMECSARDKENVDDLFREVTKQALMAPRMQKKVRKRGSLCALL